MKKKNLSLSQLTVKSFVTELDTTRATTAKGGTGRYEFTDGDPTCIIDSPPKTWICQSHPVCVTDRCSVTC